MSRQQSPEDRVPAPPDQAYDPIDWDYIDSLRKTFAEDILDHYFRAELIGADKLPDQGPLILTPNHSGNAFPHDAFVLDAMLWRHGSYRRDQKFRSVFTPQLTATWWMRPFGLNDWWRRCGGVDMSFVNYNRLLKQGHKVLHYPEGIAGIGKGFTRRYQLQHFHSSFVVLAARHDAPVYPVSIVNAEWVNPTSITFKATDRFFRRLLGLPFFPVPIAFLALLFPFIFYLAFPCRMVFVIHDRVDIKRMLREEGCRNVSNPTRETAERVAERVRQHAQKRLDASVATHGQKPYRLGGLLKQLRPLYGRILRTTPFGWPFAFLRHERDQQRPPARNLLHSLLRDIDILGYYLPFGWIVLAALRELRRPPYGYRGLSDVERKRKEGLYRWSLAENPLPEPDSPQPPPQHSRNASATR